MAGGYVKIHRSLFDHWLFKDKPFTKGLAWVHLIGLAAWKDTISDRGRVVKRGEIHTSQRWLGERWGWSPRKVHRFLELLLKSGAILYVTDRCQFTGSTIIELLNYAKYQDDGEAREVKPQEIIKKPEPKKKDYSAEYTAYLKSPEWQLKRAAVLQRCRGVCEMCRLYTATQAHHLTYERQYNENLDDLQGLCANCHYRIHKTKDKARGAA